MFFYNFAAQILNTMNEKLLDNKLPYLVADMSLAAWGRKEIEVSEHEMPGLMALRKKYGDTVRPSVATIRRTIVAVDA